jgi:hypothetical protein
MAQIAPSDIATGTSAERWGLVQKVPHGPSGSAGDHGDWFTAGADPREVGGLLEKLKKVQGETPVEGTLLEQLSTAGDRFGEFNNHIARRPLTLQDTQMLWLSSPLLGAPSLLCEHSTIRSSRRQA